MKRIFMVFTLVVSISLTGSAQNTSKKADGHEKQSIASTQEATLCRITATEVAIDKEKKEARIKIKWVWRDDVNKVSIENGNITFGFLFLPKPIPKLSSDMFKLTRDFQGTFPENGQLMCMMSGVEVKESGERGESYKGILALVFPAGKDSKINFLSIKEYTFVMQVEDGNRDLLERLKIPASGTVQVAIFKQDDPTKDQLKSATYLTLSNVFEQSMTASEPINKKMIPTSEPVKPVKTRKPLYK